MTRFTRGCRRHAHRKLRGFVGPPVGVNSLPDQGSWDADLTMDSATESLQPSLQRVLGPATPVVQSLLWTRCRVAYSPLHMPCAMQYML